MQVMPRLTYRWRIFIRGLFAAAIGGAANAVTVVVIDPLKFNLVDGKGSLAMAVAVSALVSLALYLKEHPLPDPDKDTDAYAAADKQIARLAGATDTIVERDPERNRLIT